MSILYLDFETTAVKATRPALLGVLVPDGSVRQYVVDPDLWAAAVAQKTCVPTTLPEAVDEVVREARATEAPICAWSEFDWSVINQAQDVPASMKRAVDQRYFNALTLVPAWARILYGFNPTRKGFDPARSLKKYVAFFGCPWPASLNSAKPAAWIRHIRGQLRAAGGNYRKVTHQAKRDWHRLLDYNRADLHALQCLVSRADVEMRKLAAYRGTTYRVFAGVHEIAFRIGSQKPKLDAVLAKNRVTQWAFITAWNPGTDVLSQPENRERQARLVADARTLGAEVLGVKDGRRTASGRRRARSLWGFPKAARLHWGASTDSGQLSPAGGASRRCCTGAEAASSKEAARSCEVDTRRSISPSQGRSSACSISSQRRTNDTVTVSTTSY